MQKVYQLSFPNGKKLFVAGYSSKDAIDFCFEENKTFFSFSKDEVIFEEIEDSEAFIEKMKKEFIEISLKDKSSFLMSGFEKSTYTRSLSSIKWQMEMLRLPTELKAYLN